MTRTELPFRSRLVDSARGHPEGCCLRLAATLAVLLLAPASAASAEESIWQRFTAVFRAAPAGDEPCIFRGEMSDGIELPEATPVVSRVKKEWERLLGGEAAAKPFIRARLVGRPQRLLGERPPAHLDDHTFVARIARDTWKGLDALRDKTNGLPINHVRLQPENGGIALEIGDYTGPTDIGLSLIATAAAYDLGFVDRSQAEERIAQVLRTLERLETYSGFPFNYYDTTSLERTSNFVSFVDSAWLTAGLIVVRSAFPRFQEPCSRMIEAADYRFFYDEDLRQMSHGYDVHRGRRSRYHYGVLFTESRLGSIIAIGKGDVPEEHWFAMVRTFPATCEWQKQKPQGRHWKEVRGHRFRGGWYEWNGFRYVPSWGGSMFEALMPRLMLDEERWAPRSLGRNGTTHAEVQRHYALQTLGHPVWGMSPCAMLGCGYDEYGVEPLGAAGYRAGLVTPHATALALLATPAEAVANLRQLAQRYEIYGEYGFYDAVDPRSGEVARAYLTLDQAMSFIAMANFLKDGCVQKRFASDPIVQRALPVLAAEDFLE